MRRIEFPSGSRWLFAHMEKCAGQSINRWLSEALGDAWVSPNLVGQHRQVIREFGGAYSILSGHIDFDGSGLDPRYGYFTVLREPIERMLSWIDFVLGMPDVDDYIRALKDGARAFVDSEALRSSDVFLSTIRDPYCTRLSGVVTAAPLSGSTLRQAALSALAEFDCVGLVENLPDFLSRLAPMLGMSARHPLSHVNATPIRRGREAYSTAFLARCHALVAEDSYLYETVRAGELPAAQARIAPTRGLTRHHWTRACHPIRPYWQGRGLRLYRGLDLGPGVGAVNGEGRDNDQRYGVIASGPFLQLEAGQYEAYLRGRWLSRGAICLAHVGSSAGTDLCIESIVDGGGADAEFRVSFPFTVAPDMGEIEIRLLAPALHRIALDMLAVLGGAPPDGVGIAPLVVQGDVGLMSSCGVMSTGQRGVLCRFDLSAVGTVSTVRLLGHCGPRGLAGATFLFAGADGTRQRVALLSEVIVSDDGRIAQDIVIESGNSIQLAAIEIHVEPATEMFVCALAVVSPTLTQRVVNDDEPIF